MKSALDTMIQADNGGTDYNVAFDTARAANPGAAARIFLTDGGHNAGTYNNTHLNPAPQAQTPTYVIGFSAGLSAPADQAGSSRSHPTPAAATSRCPTPRRCSRS